MQRKLLQQAEVTTLLASPIARGVAGDGFEPAPECFLAVKLPRVSNHAQQRFLQGFPGFLFLPARDDKKELIEPVKIKPVKFPKRILIAGPNSRRQGGYIRAGVVGRTLGHRLDIQREQQVGVGYLH